MTPICLGPNISKTAFDDLQQHSLVYCDPGSTIGYPSDSLASCLVMLQQQRNGTSAGNSAFDRPSVCLCVCVCVAGVDCGLPSSAGSLVDLLDAEYQLFKSVVSGSTRSSSLSRDRLLDEFCRLQQRHATLVNSLLRSHANLQQVSIYTCTLQWNLSVEMCYSYSA